MEFFSLPHFPLGDRRCKHRGVGATWAIRAVAPRSNRGEDSEEGGPTSHKMVRPVDEGVASVACFAKCVVRAADK